LDNNVFNKKENNFEKTDKRENNGDGFSLNNNEKDNLKNLLEDI
jgi:hypothetical protein